LHLDSKRFISAALEKTPEIQRGKLPQEWSQKGCHSYGSGSQDREGERRETRGYGYHHDIKLQNLLHFGQIAETKHPCPKYGFIQIADFGINEFHSKLSGTGTRTFRGTPTYAAPESKVPLKVESPGGSNAKLEIK
jgi:serine/threonine protein kinase